jgi:hypothetical protein
MRTTPVLVLLGALAALPLVAAPAHALERSVNVNGKENLFAAGRAAVPSTLDGALPHEIGFGAGAGKILTASSVRGQIDTRCGIVNPDGTGACTGSDIESFNGISGMIASGGAMMLMGVFLTDAPPSGTAPPRLDFSPGLGLGEGFLELSPQIAQAFWIGDGLTGDGDGFRQQIHVPARATRLFLGFEDGSAFHGRPCCYNDNVGGYRATIFIGRGGDRNEPDPKAGRSGVGDVATGTVCIRRRGRCIRVRDNQRIPVGSVIDTRRGSLVLKVSDGKGGVQAGTFSKGVFRFTQAREKVVGPRGQTLRVLTTRLKLTGGNFRRCSATRAARRRVIRYLKAKSTGRFRVIGKNASGIERGTSWTTTDACDGTIVRVTKGTVIVTDFTLKADFTVNAGQSYQARPRPGNTAAGVG